MTPQHTWAGRGTVSHAVCVCGCVCSPLATFSWFSFSFIAGKTQTLKVTSVPIRKYTVP